MIYFVDFQKRVQKLCILTVFLRKLLNCHVKFCILWSSLVKLFSQNRFLVHQLGGLIGNLLQFFVLLLKSRNCKYVSVLPDLCQHFFCFKLMILVFKNSESFSLLIKSLADLLEFTLFHGDLFLSFLQRFHDFGFCLPGSLYDSF